MTLGPLSTRSLSFPRSTARGWFLALAVVASLGTAGCLALVPLGRAATAPEDPPIDAIQTGDTGQAGCAEAC